MSSGEELSGDLARKTAILRRIARGIVLEPALAEDAVHDAWLAALRAGPQALSSGGWLTQAVRRIPSGLKRREARQARREHQVARRLQRDQHGIYDLSRFVSIGERGDHELELRPRGAIRVRGRVSSGATSFDGTVSAWSLDDERHSRMAFVVDSQFELDGMTEGRWRFSVFELVRSGVARHGVSEHEISAGADAAVELDLAQR